MRGLGSRDRMWGAVREQLMHFLGAPDRQEHRLPALHGDFDTLPHADLKK